MFHQRFLRGKEELKRYEATGSFQFLLSLVRSCSVEEVVETEAPLETSYFPRLHKEA